MTMEEISEAIDRAWNTKSVKMDWRGLESLLVAILKADFLRDNSKVSYSKMAIDAFTKRGYFL